MRTAGEKSDTEAKIISNRKKKMCSHISSSFVQDLYPELYIIEKKKEKKPPNKQKPLWAIRRTYANVAP